MGTPDELLRGLPGYPFTAWLLVALVGVAYLAKTVRDRPQKQSATNARMGARLQRVEQLLAAQNVRRLQVEHELTRRGVRLPYWPGDPILPALDVDEDQGDVDEYEPAETSARATVPPLPDYPRHRRSATQ
jgi:hypothetical protein